MGYELKIGQSKTVYEPDIEAVRTDCDTVFLAEAPASGEITDHAKVKRPSYSAW